MREKLYLFLSIAVLLFIIIFRAVYSNKVFNILEDRDYNTKANIENILYEEINEKIYLDKVLGYHVLNDDLKTAILDNKKEKILESLLKSKKSNDDFESILIVLENGKAYSTSSTRDGDKNYNKEDWYLKTSRKNDFCISSNVNNDGTYSFCLTYPIVIDYKFYGAYSITLDKKTIEETVSEILTNEKQVVLKDENDNVLFEMFSNLKMNDKYEKNIHSFENSENKNDNINIIMEVYYNEFDSKLVLFIIEVVFSIIYLVTLIWGINNIYFSKTKTFLLRLSIECIFILLIEWSIVLSYMVGKYDDCIAMHSNVIYEYKTNFINYMEDGCDYLENELIDAGLEQFFKDNEYIISENTHFSNKLLSTYVTEKERCKYLIDTFFIGTNGIYVSLPYVNSSNVKNINYKYYRNIINNNKLNTLSSIEENEDHIIYTKYYKIKDENGNTKGIFGINMKFNRLIDIINDLINNGEIDCIYKINKDGDIYSYGNDTLYEYEEGKKYSGEFRFKFTKEKKDNAVTINSGWFKEDNILNAIRYVYFEDFTDNDVYMMKLDIEKKEITIGVSGVSISIILCVLFVILIALKLVSKNYNRYIDPEREIKINITKKYSQNGVGEIVDKKIITRMRIFNKIDDKTNLFVDVENNDKK